MFSYEQRIKAVKLLIQYDMSYATVTRELGYPTSKSLRGWYQEYIKANSLHKTFVKQYKYTEEQKQKRIKVSLGGMSPIDYRRSLGLVV